MFLLKLALKNLNRHKRRTFITCISIAVGIALYIFMDSMLLGLSLESERNIIWYETGHALIHETGYWEDKDFTPLDLSIKNTGETLSLLDKNGYKATGRTVFNAEIIVNEDPWKSDGYLQVQTIAIDTESDESVFKLKNSLASGRYLKADEDGIMLGSWIAEDLGAQVGYPLTLVTRTRDGVYQTFDLEVVGIIDSPNPKVNRFAVYMPLDAADFYLDMAGTVTAINVSFPENVDFEEQLAKLENLIGSTGFHLETYSWRDVASDFIALAASKNSGSKVLLMFLFIIAAVGVSNTMLMAVYERVRELGMMRAMGMNPMHIRIAFLLEAAGIGILGSLSGIILGVLCNIPLVKYGIDYSSILKEMDSGYRVATIMRGTWSMSSFVSAFFFGLFISVFVAFFPTKKALKMKITDCLRYQ